METCIVDKEPCTIPKIVEIMSKSGSSSDLRRNWSRLARNLGVRKVDIAIWTVDFALNEITFEDLMVKIVTNWTTRCKDDAKMEVLFKALADCNAKDIADELENELAEIVKAHVLDTGEVSVQGKVLKVSDIFNTTADLDLPPGITELFQHNEPIQIMKDLQIPSIPRSYIQRTVSPRTRLDLDVFLSDSSDLFVLENLDRRTYSDVELSSTQTGRVTAKFIRLENPNHYEGICQVAPSDTPVHQVRFDRGNYYWVRSRGSLELIQQHVSTEQDHLSEEQYVAKYLSKFENTLACFADTPGMGLLASIAQRVKQLYPDRVVLFLVLSEKSKQRKVNDFESEVLKRVMESGRLQFELFLDGFDEVILTQFDHFNQLLSLKEEHKKVRIHVTTRPHMRNQVEKTLGVLGYNILPFTEESKNKELEDSPLKSFANQRLAMLKKNMNEQEHGIGWVPLQYSMKLSSTEFKLTCSVESIFQMYQQFIKKKMKRAEALGEGVKQKLFVAHVCEAMEVIFPDKDTCLRKIGDEDLQDLYAVGLMEPSSSDAGAKPKFLHRTFAEFLIAEHLVKHLSCTPSFRLLFHVVLGELTRDSESPESFYDNDLLLALFSEFKQNIIAYFVNAQLGAVGSDFQVASLRSSENVDEMLSACCLNANAGNLLNNWSTIDQLDMR